MSELFKYLKTLPSSTAIIIISLLIVAIVFFNIKYVTSLFKFLFGINLNKKMSCGDCALLLLGIREKFEYESTKIETSLLRKQMTYAEQVIQEAIFFLSQSFSQDIIVMGTKDDSDQKMMEAALYCEALKNSMLSVKDDVRRSFKENGFSSFSEGEMTNYVKSKTVNMITKVRSYLNSHYIENGSTISNLKKRFEKMDELHLHKFEGWSFQIFNNAKDLYIKAEKRKAEINTELKNEINSFVERNGSTKRC